MQAKRSNVPYEITRWLLRLIFLPSCRISILHRERSAVPGTWILASNHISHFDPPVLTVSTIRPIDWMAMEELFSHRVADRYLHSVNAFPIRRGKPDRAALRIASERLHHGRVVGIFPEGGIRDGAASVLEEGAIRPGFSLVANLAKASVLPVVILGTDRLYNKRHWSPFRNTQVWVGFGEMIHSVEGASHEAREGLESQLRTALHTVKAEMVAHFKLSQEDLPKSPLQRMQEQ